MAWSHNCKILIIFAKIIRMESSISKELLEMGRKIKALAAQRDEARSQLQQALEEVADLKRELTAAKEEIHRSNLDIEFLTLSHKLADTPQALAEARTTVRRLISRVDKAIALLEEDPRI